MRWFGSWLLWSWAAFLGVGGHRAEAQVRVEQARAPYGSVLVTGDRPGAPVYIDGERRGVTPTVVENLTEGEHLLEIRLPGDVIRQETIYVIGGKQVVINRIPGAAPASTGNLRVLANAPR